MQRFVLTFTNLGTALPLDALPKTKSIHPMLRKKTYVNMQTLVNVILHAKSY